MLRVVSDSGGSDAPAPRVLTVSLGGLAYDGTPVLGGIDLTVARGETVALVGPSGIGKSTLLRCIAGIETRYRGLIEAPRETAVIFQEPTLLPWRDLVANLRVPTGISQTRAEEMLEAVGLPGRGAEFPGQLSLGQQRRLALARAFAMRPKLLLMDEPFVSLDPELVEGMMGLFVRLRRDAGTTTLLVTHVEQEAERLASRIVGLGGPPARVVSDRPNRPSLGDAGAALR